MSGFRSFSKKVRSLLHPVPNRNKVPFLPVVFSIFVAICIIITFAWLFYSEQNQQPHNQNPRSQHPNNHQPPSEQQSNEKPDKEKDRIVWGVDTASKVTESFYQCVAENYGKPVFWGRYMETKEDTSFGVTKEEAKLIHEKGGKILLIYNHFTDATGYEHGVSEAKHAVSFAKDLNIPKGVALFADIEPTYPVDAGFIRGWIKTLADSQYKAGIYGDFSKNTNLREAYLTAMEKVKKQPIIWSFQPRPGITTKQNAPEYDPAAPKPAKTFVWQYGIEGEKCNIDTNLARSDVLPYLW